VVYGAGEHARELCLAHPLLQLGRLFFDVSERALVIFRSGQLEVLERLVDVLAERFGQRKLLAGYGATTQQALRLLLVVPETRFTGELIELVYFAFECREVKETPLAHRRAA
jgi:hypothetical protein